MTFSGNLKCWFQSLLLPRPLRSTMACQVPVQRMWRLQVYGIGDDNKQLVLGEREIVPNRVSLNVGILVHRFTVVLWIQFDNYWLQY